MRKSEKTSAICEECNSSILLSEWEISGKYARKHHYCSRVCSNAGKRKQMLGSGNHFWGKKHTDRAKKKQSDAKIGFVPWIAGKKHSELTKQRLSVSHKKYFLEHPELRDKLRELATGRKQSAETIEKRVSHFRNKKRPKWVVDKIKSHMPRGESHHWWLGGKSPVAYRIRRSRKMISWRIAVFTRDGFTCRSCGLKKRGLHPHHIKPFSAIMDRIIKMDGDAFDNAMRDAELWDPENGITLCVDCHKKTDNYGKNLQNKKRG